MSWLSDITVIIINFKMPGLVRGLVAEILAPYPDLRMLVIDNGSKDESTQQIAGLCDGFDNVKVILNKKNAGHGAAMHQGICMSRTPLVCLLDSDVVWKKAGGFELLFAPFSNTSTYATGELVLVNNGGNTSEDEELERDPYVLPSRMMLDREQYLGMAPFNHHGAPCVLNHRDAIAHGWELVDVPNIEEFLSHPGQGFDKGKVHELYGIPGWHHRKYYLPEDAPTALEMLKDTYPTEIGRWQT